jgi:hypothetical protein
VYGVVSTTGSFLTTFTSTVSSGNVNLNVIPSHANMIYRVKKTYQSI